MCKDYYYAFVTTAIIKELENSHLCLTKTLWTQSYEKINEDLKRCPLV